jgi:N-acetyl-alpha-D-muramate 1-phosphate uridylyltransferase
VNQQLFSVAILAGGLATRLRPLTESMPKALLDINGEPFIVHQLRLLHAHGIERVVLCIGYRGEQLVAAVGDGGRFGVHVTHSCDGPTLLGTAGAVKRALPQLGEAFFVLYGDSYLECDYWAVQAAFLASGKAALMTVYRNEQQWDTSNIEYAQGCILAYDKQRRTPRMQHIDYGLGLFWRSVFETVPEDSPYDLARVYRDLLQCNQLAAFEVAQRFYEIGSVAGLHETRRYLASKSG